MSAQLKAAYDDLVTYLGKDAKGLEKAKRLKDVANELRKKLAAAEERLEQMEVVKNAARERADVADTENATLKAENSRLQQQVGNLVKRLAEVGFEDLRLHTAASVTPAIMQDTLQRLNKIMPQCPPAIAEMRVPAGYISIFDREDLAQGWSADSLWQLGASVAMIAAAHGTMIVASSGIVCDEKRAYTGNLVWGDIRAAVSQWFGATMTSEQRDENIQRALDAAALHLENGRSVYKHIQARVLGETG